MINQSLSSTENSRKRNVRCSQPSSSGIEKHVRYSRHLSFQHQRASSNGRARLVIHTTIRSPKNSRRQIENKSALPNSDLLSVRCLFYILIHYLFILIFA
jgi:hypothetical protein